MYNQKLIKMVKGLFMGFTAVLCIVLGYSISQVQQNLRQTSQSQEEVKQDKEEKQQEQLSLTEQQVEDFLIAYYTKKIGRESVPLVFKRAKSKWGYCKHYGHERYEIMLNRALVFLPEKYLEQVVVHEVVHLQHPHHQKSFRDLVLKLQPENKILNKDLNKCYGRMVRQSDIFGMRK